MWWKRIWRCSQLTCPVRTWTERSPLVDDPARLEDVAGLGMDEHAWQRANAVRHIQYATGVVGL